MMRRMQGRMGLSQRLAALLEERVVASRREGEPRLGVRVMDDRKKLLKSDKERKHSWSVGLSRRDVVLILVSIIIAAINYLHDDIVSEENKKIAMLLDALTKKHQCEIQPDASKNI